MATLLAESPPAPPDAPAQPDGSNGASAGPVAPPATATTAVVCKRCGSQMTAGQDWCLQCGAGAPGSLGAPSWRPLATVAALVAALVLGAAVAAVAALSKGSANAPVVTTTVAAAPTSTPATTVPTTPGATATMPAKSPLGAVKPPKIPLTASTPKASEKATATTPSSEATTSTPTTGTTPTSGSGKANDESQQSAILLDTDAASTYDPYEYPASEFSGPSLAIDDDPSTAWTAAVNPATAPKMAEGLLIDLKDKQKVAVLQLITSTPGMTVQVYGAKGRPAPTSITDPAWKPLSAPKVIKKKRTRLALRDSKKEFTYITLWISQAPASAAGTATAPAHVAVDEVELFPPKG